MDLLGPPVGLAAVQQFAVTRVGARLSSEPALVAGLWTRIAADNKLPHPDLTVFRCALPNQLLLFEFVAGETLEEMVKRSDPAACELEIPLFCRLLDAFEGQSARPEKPAGLEPFDFDIRRLSAENIGKIHGALLLGPAGVEDEAFFG